MISDADTETWRDIPGWEGIYQISNLGRVKSCKVIPSGKVMRLSNKTGDYIRIVLQKNGRKNETHLVHRLVAKLFLPNPSNLPVVNHKDGNKQNNSVSNLEWCTVAENNAHAIAKGLFDPRGAKHKHLIPYADWVTIYYLNKHMGISLCELARKNRCSRGAITSIIQRLDRVFAEEANGA